MLIILFHVCDVSTFIFADSLMIIVGESGLIAIPLLTFLTVRGMHLLVVPLVVSEDFEEDSFVEFTVCDTIPHLRHRLGLALSMIFTTDVDRPI